MTSERLTVSWLVLVDISCYRVTLVSGYLGPIKLRYLNQEYYKPNCNSVL